MGPGGIERFRRRVGITYRRNSAFGSFLSVVMVTVVLGSPMWLTMIAAGEVVVGFMFVVHVVLMILTAVKFVILVVSMIIMSTMFVIFAVFMVAMGTVFAIAVVIMFPMFMGVMFAVLTVLMLIMGVRAIMSAAIRVFMRTTFVLIAGLRPPNPAIVDVITASWIGGVTVRAVDWSDADWLVIAGLLGLA